jgi:hypothetical protein
MLPVLIQVLASFTKADGVLLEEEIDSSLGFLRYDYPEAVYSSCDNYSGKRFTSSKISLPWRKSSARS